MTSTRVKVLSTAPLSPPATLLSKYGAGLWVPGHQVQPILHLSHHVFSAAVPGQNNKLFVPRNIYNTKYDPSKLVLEAAARGPTPNIASNAVIHRYSGEGVCEHGGCQW